MYCDFSYFLQNDLLEFLYKYAKDAWNFFKEVLNYLIQKDSLLTIFVGTLTLRECFSRIGHKFKIVYVISETIHCPPQISELYIYNSKNKTEIITEINVLFGVNCVFQLHEFAEPFILQPYEMKKINLERISVYSCGCKAINMKDMFNKAHNKMKFILTTPNGCYKTKRLSQFPHNTFIKKALKEDLFFYITHLSYPINGKSFDYKVKYYAELYGVKNEILGNVWIYKNGEVYTLFCSNKFFQIDLKKYNNTEKIKNYLISQKLIKKQKYTVKVFTRNYKMHEYNEEEIILPIFTKFKYIVAKIIRKLFKKH